MWSKYWLLSMLLIVVSCSEALPEEDQEDVVQNKEILDPSTQKDSQTLSYVDTTTVAGYNNQKANPNADDFPVDSTNPAILTWEEERFDFGTIQQGEKVSHDFVFTNTGRTPLIIREVYSSCGCTIPSYSIEPVAPGEKGSIHVVFDSNNKQGRIVKRVVVLANTYPEDANTVAIGGQVELK